MALFPGMGASILILSAARASFISSVRLTIFETFTPASGSISYLVTVGPTLTSVMVTFTPKLASVSFSLLEICICSSFAFPVAFVPFFSMVTGGIRYSSTLSSLSSTPSGMVDEAIFLFAGFSFTGASGSTLLIRKGSGSGSGSGSSSGSGSCHGSGSGSGHGSGSGSGHGSGSGSGSGHASVFILLTGSAAAASALFTLPCQGS